jgi:sugar lactone lactonase YvrE
MARSIPFEIAEDAHADCGESPVWDARSRRVIWVDQFPGLVHWYDPATRSSVSQSMGQIIGAIAPRDRGGLVLALADGFWLLDTEGQSPRRLMMVTADYPGSIMNDGKCDRFGRFYAGQQALDEAHPVGILYRLDPDCRVSRVLDGITVANGLAWSLDNRTFYYIDSRTQRIDAFRFDPETGTVHDRRTLISVPREDGTPDGMTTDAEGFLWVAFWGGWCIRRYSPDGALDREIRFPVAQMTSCIFGGDDLGDLYITSAAYRLGEGERSEQPHAGALFVVRPGVPGTPTDPYQG